MAGETGLEAHHGNRDGCYGGFSALLGHVLQPYYILFALVGVGKRERRPLTAEEVYRALGISRSTFYKAVQRGEIPALRIGRRVLVPVDAIEALLRQGADPRRKVSSPVLKKNARPG